MVCTYNHPSGIFLISGIANRKHLAFIFNIFPFPENINGSGGMSVCNLLKIFLDPLLLKKYVY